MRFQRQIGKSSVAVCCLVILICAATALSFGIADKIDLGQIEFLIPEDYHEIVLLPVFTIIIGCASTFTSVYGWICVILEQPHLVIVLAISCAILILMELAVSIPFRLMVNNPGKLEKELFVELEKFTPLYPTDSTLAAMNTVNWIHRTLKCCGRFLVQPYEPAYPDSCVDQGTKLNYSRTCQNAMSRKLVLSVKKLTGVLWALMVAEVFGLLAAIYLTLVLYAKYD